jgi:hypothetical protein
MLYQLHVDQKLLFKDIGLYILMHGTRTSNMKDSLNLLHDKSKP